MITQLRWVRGKGKRWVLQMKEQEVDKYPVGEASDWQDVPQDDEACPTCGREGEARTEHEAKDTLHLDIPTGNLGPPGSQGSPPKQKLHIKSN